MIDREIEALIDGVTESEGITTSAIVRDALRSYFKLDDARGRGWREGLAAGIADVQRRIREVLTGLDSDALRDR